jgi:hypothetical protein
MAEERHHEHRDDAESHHHEHGKHAHTDEMPGRELDAATYRPARRNEYMSTPMIWSTIAKSLGRFTSSSFLELITDLQTRLYSPGPAATSWSRSRPGFEDDHRGALCADPIDDRPAVFAGRARQQHQPA